MLVKCRILSVGVAVACLGLLLSACGQSAAPASAPVKSRPQATSTAVPSPLVAFASYSDPILRTSLGEGSDLLQKMKHSKPGDLGDQCGMVGGDLSNSQTALRLGYTPRQGMPAFHTAVQGFKLVLSASDECGMAADTNSPGEMKVATKDMEYGLWLLSQAESAMAHWQQSS
jgi:hypothetical protein